MLSWNFYGIVLAILRGCMKTVLYGGAEVATMFAGLITVPASM